MLTVVCLVKEVFIRYFTSWANIQLKCRMERFCISGLIREMLMLDYGMQEAEGMAYGHVNEEKSARGERCSRRFFSLKGCVGCCLCEWGSWAEPPSCWTVALSGAVCVVLAENS